MSDGPAPVAKGSDLPGTPARATPPDARARARELPPGGAPTVVATDLDGTLLRSDGALSARTEQVLRHACGVGMRVIFVTARPPRWVDHFADVAGTDGIILCANGAFVYDVRSRQVVEEHTMAEEVVRPILAELRRELPGIVFGMERVDGLVLEPGFEAQYAPAGTRRGRAEDLFDRLPGKLLARCSRMPAEEFHRRIEEVLGDRLRHSFSGAVGLAEIGAPDVTKAAALDRWTVEHGYTAAQVWAFGDMPNDLPMLRWAGAGVAVANAHRRVIDEADLVCPSNDEDGVAQVVGLLTRAPLSLRNRGPLT
ncbi:MAG: HAD family phosphatase [Austwickia sp.]|nr:HAD family phosphatase [Austwickia sp.]MBK8435178.1 HAD family phosphatase [Austwickia sp.]MBK9101268.1 HAD family phosphatase [Austwickia sp.]